MRLRTSALICLTTLASASATYAAKTTTYKYDAKGRLVRVVRSDSTNNGVTTEYTYDKADNRAQVRTNGR